MLKHYEVFECYEHEDAAVQKRAEAVEFASTLIPTANVRVRGFHQSKERNDVGKRIG